MIRIAADENLHMVFYRDILAAALKVQPSAAVRAIVDEVLAFEMPGAGIPNFLRKAAQMAKAGIYDLRVHRDEVLLPIIQHWGIFELEGLDAAAEEARTSAWPSTSTELDVAAKRFEARIEASGVVGWPLQADGIAMPRDRRHAAAANQTRSSRCRSVTSTKPRRRRSRRSSTDRLRRRSPSTPHKSAYPTITTRSVVGDWIEAFLDGPPADGAVRGRRARSSDARSSSVRGERLADLRRESDTPDPLRPADGRASRRPS